MGDVTSLTLVNTDWKVFLPLTGVRRTKGSLFSLLVPKLISSSPVNLKDSTTNAASRIVNGEDGLEPSRMLNCSNAVLAASGIVIE